VTTVDVNVFFSALIACDLKTAPLFVALSVTIPVVLRFE
jgi:hypothetical protein